jgi:phage major head subunit gpT-like protein
VEIYSYVQCVFIDVDSGPASSALAATSAVKRCNMCQCAIKSNSHATKCIPCWRKFCTDYPTHPSVVAAAAKSTKSNVVPKPGPVVKKPSLAELTADRAMIASADADDLDA